jgi:C1A family cysteine protease
VNLPRYSYSALQKAVNLTPVSIAIASRSSVYRFYKSGIINSSYCGTRVDHAVLVVGYGSSNGQRYWIIKNSWGSSWGEKGYQRVAMTTGSNAGICGIYSMMSYPVLA